MNTAEFDQQEWSVPDGDSGQPRHARLRAGTATLHRAVESAMEAAGCFTSADGYGRYLAAVYPVYAGIEARVEAAGAASIIPDWAERRKAGLIEAELGGVDRVSAIPRYVAPSGPWGCGDIFGAIYVVEGATLGGAILVKRLRALGIAAEPGATLLDPYGARRGRFWRSFVSSMDSAAFSEDAERAMFRRAQQVFAAFLDLGRRLAAPENSA